MNNVILSGEYPQFADALRSRGFHVIESEKIDSLIPYERSHADMQCLILDDTAFVASPCRGLAHNLSERYHVVTCADTICGKYPANVALNCAVVGKNVIAREDTMDPKVREYCKDHGYQIISVRQGYAKCSCTIVSDNAIITADKGIYNSLKETNIEALLIGQGRVKLPGAAYGFIGGASGLDVLNGTRTLYFCGNIAGHPDFQKIKAFCEMHKTKIISLSSDDLTDIGGMIFC